MISSSNAKNEDSAASELPLPSSSDSSFKKKTIERNWLNPESEGIEALAKIEFLHTIPGEKQLKFVPSVKGVLTNAVHKMALQLTQQQDEIINEAMNFSATSLITQTGSKAMLMSTAIGAAEEQQQRGSIFVSLSNASDFDPNMGFDAIKSKLSKTHSIITKDIQELFLKSIPPWNFVVPHHTWKVRLHGDRAVGKTTLQKSICRMDTNTEQHRNQHCDTIGSTTTNTLMPIKCVDSVKWIELEVVDVGEGCAINNPIYNSYNVNDFHAHLVLFSMGHFQSFKNAKNKIKQLKKQTNNIIVVATKSDAFQNFQVTDTDISTLVKECELKTAVCLVNNHAQFGSENSTYSIVEELADLLLA